MPGFDERRRLTFEQAEGAAPLPRQLQPKEISPELRARLWETINVNFEQHRFRMGGQTESLKPWDRIFDAMHVLRHHRMADDFENNYYNLVAETKEVFLKGDYLAVFGWIQWVLRRPEVPEVLSVHVNRVLEVSRAAYRVIDGDTIVPVGSDAERETLQRALADLTVTEFHGTGAHLRKAAEEATAGHYADSVRESIHAVESGAGFAAGCQLQPRPRQDRQEDDNSRRNEIRFSRAISTAF